jgi:sterol desaturase/sphingolipid hydroxylase (fatty acid hydroxylase superfamily)
VYPDEISIRLGAFAVTFVSIAVWEAAVPRRKRSYSRFRRWPSNLAASALNQVLVRLVLSFTIVASAIIATNRSWGIFNNISVPQWLAAATSVVLLDLVIYLQHVLFHAVPAFWRFHRVHHADLDFDVSTGVRFHPFEILLSVLLKSMAVVALGAPAVSVLTFEVLLNATSMFNHGNVRIAGSIDRLLRWILVTPDMHRVHHSILPKETNSNFGFNLAWWDRLFGTYRNQPAAGHERMTIGIEQFRDIRELLLDRMLLQPFRGSAGAYSRLFRGDA